MKIEVQFCPEQALPVPVWHAARPKPATPVFPLPGLGQVLVALMMMLIAAAAGREVFEMASHDM